MIMMVRESVGGAEDGQNIKVGVLGVICPGVPLGFEKL